MSGARILHARDHPRMPWKNGGGETIEIAVHPPGAGLAGFDWRISMASVVTDGPFSRFEGIDRTLAVLTGRGMDLEIEGMGRRSLTVGSDPLTFPADAPTVARLQDGAITDLNVMTRRGAAEHRVERVVVERETTLVTASAWTLFLARGAVMIGRPGEAGAALGLDDAVLVEGGATLVLSAEEPTTGFLVRIETAGEAVVRRR